MGKEITVKVDAELLARVMEITNAKSEDEALEEGLKVISTTAWLEGAWKPDRIRMMPQELREMFDPNYDPDEPYGYKNMPAPPVVAHAQ